MTTLVAGELRAQLGGEHIQAWVLDIPSDVFGCSGEGACNLRYRMYHTLAGTPEINAAPWLDGFPEFRRRSAYKTDPTLTENFPSTSGRYGYPFYVVWDGVLSPGSADHVGYYGAQSQIIHAGELGDSSRQNCSAAPGQSACFEPLSSITSSQTLRGGVSSIGGLAPIPVPRARAVGGGELEVEWERGHGYTVRDGAPVPVVGYRLFAYPGRNPSEGALRGARPVGETGSLAETRLLVPADHPALAGADEVTLVLKMVYVGNLESLFFSANSDLVRLDGGEDDDDEDEDEGRDEDADQDPDGEGGEPGAEGAGPGQAGSPAGSAISGGDGAAGESPGRSGETDGDGDGVPDRIDLCPGLADPEQLDADGDGIGDACDPDADGDGVPDDLDCDPTDATAGDPPASVSGPLAVGGSQVTVLAWPPGHGPHLIYRGRRVAGEPFRYSHACLAAGITGGRMDDPDLPPRGDAFYYLATGDSTCGPALPGKASDGTPRPAGEKCLRARLAGPPAAGPAVWRLRPSGGPGQSLRLELILDPPASARDLYAVSFEVVFDPVQITPQGPPRAGELLAEPGAPLRVDVQGQPTSGRVRITVSRTGLSGGLPVESGAGALVSTDWHVQGSGLVEVRVQAVQALNSSYDSVSVPPPAVPFQLLVD